jgi:sodium/potassium/calcium exchanger 6
LLDYLELYYCRFGKARGVPFLILASWLGILFSTIGIAASDFFCVNLSTIASILGMSESMAGVTFLAFGNGSPDVFSTFAAMKADSGSLAIGELIGAACFITAVVAGSMAIVRPFKVGRKSFMRDVSFFAVAVMFGLFFLADGRIQMWECIAMIIFYLFYVFFVIGWHWMAGRRKRRRRKERHAREHYTAPEEELLLPEEEDEDGGVGGGDDALQSHDFGVLESGVGGEDEEDEEEREEREYAELSNNMRIRPGTDRRLSNAPPHPIRPSLVGALEFRAVLNSLEKTKNLRGGQIHLRRYSDDPMYTLMGSEPAPVVPDIMMDGEDLRATPQSLLRPAAGPNGRTRAVSVNDAALARVNDDYFGPQGHIPELLVVVSDDERETPQKQQQNAMELPAVQRIEPPTQFLAPPSSTHTSPAHSPPGTRPTSPALKPILGRLVDTDTNSIDSNVISESPRGTRSPIRSRPTSPHSLRLPRASIESSLGVFNQQQQQRKRYKFWPYGILPPPQVLYDTLFPTLRNFGDKTWIEKFLALVAVPSVFLLTITLPVVEGPDKPSDLTTLNSLPPESPSSIMTATTAATPMMPVSTPQPAAKGWNRWLLAVQCITAPIFIVLVLFLDSSTPLTKPILYALMVGLTSLAILLTLTSPTKPPRLHYLCCFLGFVVAISWISTIAEEVVGILKAFGVIFGISDAILGLTIFAVGNSLGDLVADITVARLGFPVMALSACFGGPMLNILLGIGISGLYMTITKRDPVYRIEVSSTLVISAATLLLTLLVLLVWVPLNKWMMTRRIGWTLIALWTVSTVLNVVVEITGMGSKWGRAIQGSG